MPIECRSDYYNYNPNFDKLIGDNVALCTVVSGVVVVVVVVVVGVCNRSQMRTSKCTCLIFGGSIGLDPEARNTK